LNILRSIDRAYERRPESVSYRAAQLYKKAVTRADVGVNWDRKRAVHAAQKLACVVVVEAYQTKLVHVKQSELAQDESEGLRKP
jgi:hypothetical protein